ncbi:MAG: hypothetical protein WC538_18250 [Thermoanaerobaculia bacterium]|jgi:hypothetical protein
MKRHVSLISIVVLWLALGASAQQQRLEAGYPSLLSSTPVYAEARGPQRIGSIVPTAEGWIVAWADYSNPSSPSPARRLLATRLLPDGTVVDTIGIPLGADDSYASFTSVPDGAGSRVFWMPQVLTSAEIPSATVTDKGEVTYLPLVSGYSADYIPTALSAAVAGSRTALLAQGQVMLYDGSRYLRTVDIGGVGEPSSIVATSSHFVVTWVAAGNVFMCQTLDLDGNPTGRAGGTGVGFPTSSGTAAASKNGAILAWSEGAWVRIASVNLTTGTIELRASVLGEYAQPRAVWTGSSYLVAWVDSQGHGVYGVHVSALGELLDAEPRLLYGDYPGSFSLAAREGVVMMLHQSGSCYRWSCETDVWVTTLGDDPPTTRLVSAAARAQSFPLAASNGSSFLALWNEGLELIAARTTAGERTPTAPFTVFARADSLLTAAASTGRDFLVTSIGSTGAKDAIIGTLVPAEENTAVRSTFAIDPGAAGAYSLAAGASPTRYLVAWQTDVDMRAVRVLEDGQLIDSVPIPLLSSFPVSRPEAVGFDGQDFVVLSYHAARLIEGDEKDAVLTHRVTVDGTATFDRVWSTGTIIDAALGCGADTCLVVWTESIDPYRLTWAVRGSRFRKGGELIDGEAFTIRVDSIQSHPNVSWNGSRFVVSWNAVDNDSKPTVEAWTVPSSGPVDPPGASGADQIGEGYPTTPVACAFDGRCILLTTGLVDDKTLGRSSRLFKRFFGEARHRGVRR